MVKIDTVPTDTALAALSKAAKARGITYGALVATTTQMERKQIILDYQKGGIRDAQKNDREHAHGR